MPNRDPIVTLIPTLPGGHGHGGHGHGGHGHGHGHDHHDHDQSVTSVSLVCDSLLDMERLERWLAQLIHDQADTRDSTYPPRLMRPTSP